MPGTERLPPTLLKSLERLSFAKSLLLREGNDVVGSDVFGRDVLGSEVVGKEVLGSDVLGSDVLGNDVLGSEILGIEALGSVVLGKEVLGRLTFGAIGNLGLSVFSWLFVPMLEMFVFIPSTFAKASVGAFCPSESSLPPHFLYRVFSFSCSWFCFALISFNNACCLFCRLSIFF